MSFLRRQERIGGGDDPPSGSALTCPSHYQPNTRERGFMKRVAIIGTRGYPSYYGGFETAVRKLAPHLANRGWEVTVYGRPATTAASDPNADPRVKTVVTRGLETRSLSTLSFGLTSTAHAARARPDVALIMNVANGFWLPMLRARGIPTVVNVDGIEWEREKWSQFGRAVFHAGAKATARIADNIIVDSVEIGRRWRDEFNVSGRFIPYGGDEVGPLPLQEDGLTKGTYVLVVARFVPENSIGEFIEAAAELAKHRDIVLVGSSGYSGEIEERIKHLIALNPSRVRWLGHISDDERLFGLWQHAGAYFHGHSVGGTNPALVQAMACGVPIVARDTPYNREVLGDAGILTAVDVASLTSSLERILDDHAQRERLREAAMTRARTFYSWEGVCDAYEAALDDAIHAARK